MDIAALGRQFGLDEAQTRAALNALAPIVAAGMRRNAGQSPEGLQDIFRSVLTGGHERTLDDEKAISFDNAKPAGDEVLGQIFGDKEVSREVAQRLSASSGIGAAILKKLLPVVAAIVMGALAKKMGSGGAVAAEQNQPTGSGGGLGDVLKDVLGGGQQPPQPVPQSQPPMQAPNSGSSNPLEDVLNDILSGGGNQGRVIVRQIPPEQMGKILRDIFGGKVPDGADGINVPQRQVPDETITRGRNILDDILGSGTKTGNAADDLLNSVESTVRRR